MIFRWNFYAPVMSIISIVHLILMNYISIWNLCSLAQYGRRAAIMAIEAGQPSPLKFILTKWYSEHEVCVYIKLEHGGGGLLNMGCPTFEQLLLPNKMFIQQS